jgi:hypothetical protein
VLDHSCQVQRAPLSERGDDAYMTPPCATWALLQRATLPYCLWEPACGDGTGILDPLRVARHEVIGSDLVDYGRPDCFWRRDFLMEQLPPGCEAIVTNPPYKLVEEFVAHALDICPRVVMLLRLAFYESERRRDLLEGRGLARIHCFRKRLPMMHRRGWEGRKANSGMAFAWFDWNRNHTGPTTIDRISWETASANSRTSVDAKLDGPAPALDSETPDIPDFLRRAAPPDRLRPTGSPGELQRDQKAAP